MKLTPSNKETYPWIYPSDKPVAVLFYQGFLCTQTQAVRYIGNQKIKLTTGEVAYANLPGIHTIPAKSLWLYPEIEEINRVPNFSLTAWLYSWLHWLQGINQSHEKEQVIEGLHVHEPKESGSVLSYDISNQKCSLGQVTDVESHRKKYLALTQRFLNQEIDIISYGVSRGGATTFRALAQNQYQNIKLCILEGPPSSIHGLFKGYFTPYFGSLLYNRVIANIFLGAQHQLDHAQQAIAFAKKFPPNVPLVIVSSIKDEIVHHQNSLKLALAVASYRYNSSNRYNPFNQSNQPTAPVYFLQLKQAYHNEYWLYHTEDGQRYQNFIHAVYKKHNLPYIEAFAHQGLKDLHMCELTQGLLSEQVFFQTRFKIQKSLRTQIRTKALHAYQKQMPNLDNEEQEYARQVCIHMPLYSKHTPLLSRTFFGLNPFQRMLLQTQSKPESTTNESITIMNK